MYYTYCENDHKLVILCFQHYLKVHAVRSHSCDCGQAFSTSALLAHHQRACGLELLCCCGRSFTSVASLQTHARRSAHVFHHSTVEALRLRVLFFFTLELDVGEGIVLQLVVCVCLCI